MSVLTSVAMGAGIMVGAAPAAVAACPQSKFYEKRFSDTEIQELTRSAGEEPAARAKRLFAEGIQKEGIVAGEVIVGTGIDRSATSVPPIIFSDTVYSIIGESGYKVVESQQLATDSGVAGVARVEQKSAVDCKGPIEV